MRHSNLASTKLPAWSTANWCSRECRFNRVVAPIPCNIFQSYLTIQQNFDIFLGLTIYTMLGVHMYSSAIDIRSNRFYVIVILISRLSMLLALANHDDINLYGWKFFRAKLQCFLPIARSVVFALFSIAAKITGCNPRNGNRPRLLLSTPFSVCSHLKIKTYNHVTTHPPLHPYAMKENANFYIVLSDYTLAVQ